jgi:hypothetical protein
MMFEQPNNDGQRSVMTYSQQPSIAMACILLHSDDSDDVQTTAACSQRRRIALYECHFFEGFADASTRFPIVSFDETKENEIAVWQ